MAVEITLKANDAQAQNAVEQLLALRTERPELSKDVFQLLVKLLQESLYFTRDEGLSTPGADQVDVRFQVAKGFFELIAALRAGQGDTHVGV